MAESLQHEQPAMALKQQILLKALRLQLGELVLETPAQKMHRLSQRLGGKIWIKREDMQSVHSFKLRGAYAKLLSLPAVQRRAGVICASAGNHAQGMALAATHLGVKATVVMPDITPQIKLDSVTELGARVVIHGGTFDAACEHAMALAQQQGACFVHPYDDLEVMAGQATAALELLKQLPQDPDYLFVPVGGGGLAAGMAAVFGQLSPGCKIIGVEAEESASMQAARQAGRPVALDSIGTFAEGVAVKQVGELTYSICKQSLHDIVTVSTDEICAAIQEIYDDTRAVAEPAGALAVAGLSRYCREHKPSEFRAAAVLSGANISFARLRHVAERAALGAEHEALFAVTIPERPGSFLQFCEAIGERDITEFSYRYNDSSQAQVFVGIALRRGLQEKAWIQQSLRSAGYPVEDLSDNEIAKLHIRYLVGGCAPVEDERLLRFEYPERSGALLDFLRGVQTQWNISLFHYRNHGSDFGRVLIGVQVPQQHRQRFAGFLDQTGYPYQWEETNPAYQRFLQPSL